MNSRTTVEKLVGDHLVYAQKLARKFKKRLPSFVDFDDILSSAYVGLVESANKYRATDGSFTTYAFRRIYGSIQDFLRKEYFPELADMTQITTTKSSNICDLLDFLERNIGIRATDMVKMYVLDNFSLEEVGHKHKLSAARVSQILQEATNKLQKYQVYDLAA